MFVFRMHKMIYSFFFSYIIVGPKGSTGFSPFHSMPKVHAEEEEVSEDGRRKSILPKCTAEDDLVLDRPKSQDRKVPRRPRQSP